MAGQSNYALFNNGAAGTATAQILVGGQFLLMVQGTFGSVQVKMKDQFGNFINYGAAIVANSCTLIWLPDGVVQVVATGGSAYYISLAPIPTMTRR